MIPSNYRSIALAACAAFVLTSSSLPIYAANARQQEESMLRKGSQAWNEMRMHNPDAPVDLAGAKLNGRRLREVNFSRADMAGANLSQSDFGDSDFRNANLHGAKLDGSFMGGSQASGADFTGASFTGVSASKADFSRANMASTVLRRAELTKANFAGADLRGADLRESSMEYADLGNADLRAANFWLSSTGGVNFNGALISDETVLPNGKPGSAAWAAAHGAVFKPVVRRVASPTNASFVETPKLRAAGQPGVSVKPPLAATLKPLRAWRPDPSTIAYDGDQYEQLKSNVTKWNRMRKEQPGLKIRLAQAPLENRVLAYADLHGADLSKASFKRTDLDEADLRDANLRGADLRGANLQQVDFRRADLRGANLWLANTSRSKFDGAIVSPETVLDNGKKATRAWADDHAARFTEE